MAKKRKRPCSQKKNTLPYNCHTNANIHHAHNTVHHPVISLYYRQVLTLRQYLLCQLPLSSKVRRRRVASFGIAPATGSIASPAKNGDHHGPADPGPAHVPDLVRLLDTTLVGVLHELPETVSQERRRDLVTFTQSQSQSQSQLGGTCAQSEIVEYVVATLFNRNKRPQHILAQGFQRLSGPANENKAPSHILGIIIQYPNKNVQSLQRVPWTDVLDLLGSHGEEIMLRLLLDCAIFPCMDYRKGVFYQLSGLPLSNLEPLDRSFPAPDQLPKPAIGDSSRLDTKTGGKQAQNKPNNIIFLRRRTLYSRPALNAQGQVRFGLKHDHVLNRLSSADSLPQTINLMQHIFPKQFGLPNAFTSMTYQGSFNHSFRLEEQEQTPKIPKRLRGTLVELLQGLQRRNKHCSYTELLRYYCPSDSNGPWKFPRDSQSDLGMPDDGLKSSASQPLITQAQPPRRETDKESEQKAPPPPKYSLTDYATPASSVSAFCRAVLRKLVPLQFFGIGHQGLSNKQTIFNHVDRFIRMRRFESLNLHEVSQGLKITCIPWLETPQTSTSASVSSQRPKLCRSDMQKRTELLHEFVHFLFDSIVIPLIRTNFYVTESQTHRNRLFFFRHDVWRRLTEQPLAELKSSVFEELKPETARRLLERRSLGYSSLRLLPKATGVRPLLNLRRRAWMKSRWPGRQGSSYLGPSINSTITPIYNMLNYERTRGPDALGSSLYSVGDIHLRLRSFKEQLLQQQHHHQLPPLYFVKLDIQSCFDTIPQQKLIRLIEQLVSEETYHITKHVELRPADEFGTQWPQRDTEAGRQTTHIPKVQRKFVGRAAPSMNPQNLPDSFTSGTVSRRRNTVFVDTQHREYDSEGLLDLLDEHVRNNLVRIGKKYFRQRSGIPQGSMLSSLLCNYFYAELERDVLHFLDPAQALLLRLVDDFLLITSNIDLATRFLHCMLRGHPTYGITVNLTKSLINFSAAVDGIQTPRLESNDPGFPYCGNLINTHTLEISRDPHRALEGSEGTSAAEALSNAQTVESARAPGRTLHRKVLTGFKLQMHPMYLDTQHNSRAAVLANLYANMVTSAMKMVRYLRALQSRCQNRRAQPSPAVIIQIIQDVSLLAQRLVRSRWESAPQATEVGQIPPSHIHHLTTSAFRFVLIRKQTRYVQVLRWLDGVGKATRPRADGSAARIARVVREGNSVFGGWRF